MVFFCFIDTLQGGGVERVCLDYARVLSSQGHDVLIAPFNGKIGMTIPDRCILVGDYNFSKQPETEIQKVLQEHRCASNDIVFMFHMRRSTAYLAKNIDFFASFGLGSCLFLHSSLAHSYGIVEGNPFKTLKLKHFVEFWRIPKILKKSRARLNELLVIQQHCMILAVSPAIQNECADYGIHNVKVFENGVDLPYINDLASRDTGVCGGEYIVHVARLSSEKRQELLLRAFALSQSKLKLLILGDGPLRSHLEKLVKELKIADSVVFAGFVENPYPIIKQAKFSIVCSDWEGFGLSIAESLCLSTPVLMTDRPYGVRQLLGSYDEDFVCENNMLALADRIRALSDAPQKKYSDRDFWNRISLEKIVCRFISEITAIHAKC